MCAPTLLVVLQCIARCVSFPSVVVCASALQFHVYHCIAFLHCSCVCGFGVTALVVVIPRISQVVGGFNLYAKAKNAPYRLE